MKLMGALFVATCVLTASAASAQTLVTWDSPVNVSATDGALTKTGGCEGCPDAGAFSAAQLTGDGYTEFVPSTGERFFAGLGNDLTSSTGYATINYAFSFWPSGSWEIRELGTYKTEGTFVAGDHFRVAVENGIVVYRQNGAVVYTSTAPAYPLVLDTSLLSIGASLSGATVASGTATTTTTTTTTTTPPPTTTTTSSGPVRTAIAPYLAVVDRNAYPKPALPAIGPAGSAIVDPTFSSSITRVTDGGTRPGYLNRSFRTPSSPHQNAWSANGSYFYVVSDDGTVIPFAFAAATATANRIQPSASGNGGMTLSFYIEPQFSYVTDSIIYGSYSGSGATLHTIDQYDFSTGTYTQLLNLDNVTSGLSGTYIGGIGSSAGSTERIMAFYGGTSQDHHHLAIVFDKGNPQNRSVVDSWASTVNGSAANITLNFSLHHVAIDRSGRYVMLYTTSADQGSPRYAAQEYLWDTSTNLFTALDGSAHPYGHDSWGYGTLVNQDCCTTSTWDAAQWQFRYLSAPLTTRDVIVNVLSPKEVYLADHSTWNNAQPNALMPYVSGLYRYGTNTVAWRAWDDEIVAIQTDAAAGVDPTVWRFAHHRSNIASDSNSSQVSFWYEPRPNISHDGNWVLFTSNWEKTLGTDPAGDTSTTYRQDAFIVALAPSTATPAPTPTPTIVPVAITTTSLPAGTVGAAYSATLAASGGGGTYTWSVTGGSLPSGIALAAATGVLSGTPQTAGSYPVTISVSDAADSSNAAAASFTIAIAAVPVAVTTAALPSGRETVTYSTTTLQAQGGSGSYTWSGTMPPGLTLNSSTGTIAGTPTTAGTYNVAVTVTDATDATSTATVTYPVSISAAVKITSSRTLPNARRNVAYNYAVQASNVQGTPTWELVGGSLPPGLTLNSATGVIAGTPTSAGTYSFNVRVTDVSTTDTRTLAIAVKK